MKIKLTIEIEEHMMSRLHTISKLKDVPVEELLQTFIQRQVIFEEDRQITKRIQDMPIEFQLENFDA
ncbi:hypothetical protein HMPREF9630_01259 [Peptoanaerobacter stomatis]|uniref:Uncharacterized protein n=2 Tax=Peptoanaerobacter stomatis TaxID=796937 RepID=G9X3L4_9FIRM|nr:hypothetical protein [Peptoanaerobacter stomatis]EHL09979.1 hypothetical protein HMPREF9629_00971 [Peptoanaerobacter stomatis]EHL18003.1 hypothetical protein HMPREF9630_01259 [Peptoanaerobacter stomatis]EHL19853.1 hypothetical protein HMPREF9628_01186 [Peptoanaerobacter stomatis]NWO25875.1 hypothetical protein [Peptostreptococcaceae bacterium oral taxon 081]